MVKAIDQATPLRVGNPFYGEVMREAEMARGAETRAKGNKRRIISS